MNFFLKVNIPHLKPAISYEDKIYLIGSCFTEHVTNFFRKAKFQVEENAHGILFNPLSVCRSLHDVIEKRMYTEEDLFQLNEYWHSWYHHSDFSDLKKEHVLQKINQTIAQHHEFLKTSKFLIITLGSAFAYYLNEKKMYVSNNHRAPQSWFTKELLSIETITDELKNLQKTLAIFNPELKIIFTISPVRHSRDGVIENNRSKARLLEAVHSMNDCYYFPSYEIVIDELRDYRFYDADLVHPNYAATQYVWQQFVSHCIDSGCHDTMKEMEEIHLAFRHRPKSTESIAHRQFLSNFYQKTKVMQQRLPFLNFKDELNYFANEIKERL
jgi:hypothetical protein